jgi:mannose-6-phosphate isomerase-like protein (cupin superfamily)
VRKRVLLRAGQLPPVTQFAEARFPPGEGVAAHAHADMGEVFLVVDGRGTFTVDGVAHEAGPGDCVAVGPGETHALVNSGSDDWVLVYFGVVAAPR